MAKKVFMIAPFEALTGNLSGDQDLQYAENNNPAYEAPDGVQYARNYHTRYIGSRRGKDGLVYFSVRQTNAAVLNGKTRMQMALIGAIAAIKSKLKTDGTLATIKSAYDYILDRGLDLPEGVDTFNKYVDYYLRDMLRYKRDTWQFTQASISFVVNNPFKLDNTNALLISQPVWTKFVDVLGYSAGEIGHFEIDGNRFINPNITTSWDALLSMAKSPNLTALYRPITIVSESVKFNGLQVYSEGGTAQTQSDEPANGTYTTIVPA